MKRVFFFLLMLFLLASTTSALCESKFHAYMDIPMDSSMEVFVSKLEEETGISLYQDPVCKSIDTVKWKKRDNQEVSLLGMPVEKILLKYSKSKTLVESLSFTIRGQSMTPEDLKKELFWDMSVFADALVKKYGAPTSIRLMLSANALEDMEQEAPVGSFAKPMTYIEGKIMKEGQFLATLAWKNIFLDYFWVLQPDGTPEGYIMLNYQGGYETTPGVTAATLDDLSTIYPPVNAGL